jgi:predicted nuclease of predicted toxin-antitoxin system
LRRQILVDELINSRTIEALRDCGHHVLHIVNDNIAAAERTEDELLDIAYKRRRILLTAAVAIKAAYRRRREARKRCAGVILANSNETAAIQATKVLDVLDAFGDLPFTCKIERTALSR